jgi:hypothetical protein
MEEALFQFLRSVHGSERYLYDMAYNYIAALNTYSANPDVEVRGTAYTCLAWDPPR